ncbi:MAG TPA: peptidoglycan-binding protein [Nitrospirales bacterium]|nr:peptidoglycan-binding protein [Nitrospirales bacterium]
MQRALSFPSNRIDGIFGKQTDRAVRAFQKQHGMPVDGKVGHDIINALR